MAIAVYVHPESMTTAQYEDAMKRLAAAGARKPKGRLHHSCFGTDGALMVYDIWDSQASWDEFLGILGPIMGEIGIVAEPQVMPVVNMID